MEYVCLCIRDLLIFTTVNSTFYVIQKVEALNSSSGGSGLNIADILYPNFTWLDTTRDLPRHVLSSTRNMYDLLPAWRTK